MTLTEEQQKQLEEVVKPVMEWLSNNCHPHTTIIIDVTNAELVEVVMQNLRVSEKTIDEVRAVEILEELDEDLMRCGIDDNQKVDELRSEYLDRLTEIKDDIKRYNLSESIKHKISEWYAGT